MAAVNSNFRSEHDSIGDRTVPKDAYYGVQSLRASENFHITGLKMHPEIINSIAEIKKASAITNLEIGLLDKKVADAIVQACDEIVAGEFHDAFIVDAIQGGAGTSLNMNANEVIANRAIEILGGEKGDYSLVNPNDHVNCGQSTNDVFPSAGKIAVLKLLIKAQIQLQRLYKALSDKAEEFDDVLKMGRTQLQDAVPMTSGQEFTAFANTLEEEIGNLNRNVELMLEINMGATAIGTGLNAVPGYAELCTKKLAELTGENFTLGKDLVEATPDTGDYVSYSGALKRLAVKLSKICNDLRLMASGPRCGLHEINLPPMAPGSSIMPGKVNPVIPEVTNQTCFKVIGNDTTVMIAAEAGQLQLNVMEPVITQCIIESQTWLGRAMDTLRERCVDGITVNAEHNAETVRNSIGIVTALNPYIGYKNSTKIAKEALETGASVYDLVLRDKILTKEKLDAILDPKHMLDPMDVIK